MNTELFSPRLKSRLRISLMILQAIVLALCACIYFSHGRAFAVFGIVPTMVILGSFTSLLLLFSFLAAVLLRWWLPALLGLIISAIALFPILLLF